MATARAPRIVRNILRVLLLALILGVNGIIFWRFCSAGIPKKVKYIQPNEVLATAYAAADGNLTAFRQEQASITRGANNYGYFSVEQCTFFPDAGQVQIVFRYNKSTLKHLAEDKELDEIPEKAGTHFDVTLLKTTDLTPEDKTDNLDPATLASERFFASAEPVREETALYTYFRYTFDGVFLDDDTDGVFVDVYWLGDKDYSQTPYGTLCLWDAASENIPVKLTRTERKAIETFAAG